MNEKRFSKIFVLVFILTCVVVPVFHLIDSAVNPSEKNEHHTYHRPSDKALQIDLPYASVPLFPEGITSKSDGSCKPVKAAPPKLGKAPEGYFKDALFIGDSRTVGIWEYGDFSKSDFFCSTGMTTIDIFKDKIKVPGVGKVSLKELLNRKQYGKIYVMLGINELGYPEESIRAAYSKLIRYIHKAQPDALIYIQGNLHITKKRSDSDEYFNNDRINSINRFTEKLADNVHIFYIEANSKFDDKNGALAKKYSADDAHLLAKYYLDWCQWIRNHTVKQ